MSQLTNFLNKTTARRKAMADRFTENLIVTSEEIQEEKRRKTKGYILKNQDLNRSERRSLLHKEAAKEKYQGSDREAVRNNRKSTMGRFHGSEHRTYRRMSHFTIMTQDARIQQIQKYN